MYDYVITKLTQLGYEHYEISSFCKKQKYGRHNIKYWNNSEYIGVGISATSYIDSKRYEKIRKLVDYYKKLDNNEIPINEKTIEIVNEKEISNLKYIVGLRNLKDGIEYDESKKLEIQKNIDNGYLKKIDNRIYLTKKGIFFADSIILEFID